MRTMICLHGFTTEQEEMIGRMAPDWEIHYGRTSDIDQEVYRRAEIVCGWNGDAARECLKPESKLRWVQTWSAGVDKLPLDAFRRKGILLTDAGGVHPAPVAETTLALMLGLTRGIHHAVRDQAAARWGKPPALPEMHGKTAVIVGAGSIGARIGELAKAFGMRTLGVRRSDGAVPGIDAMYKLEQLDEALAESDYVVNVLPGTDATHHLFNADRFAHMKSNALFINVGRGSSVDTESLVAALQSGTIAGAGLDVFEEEPLPPEHPLWKLDNVILTPHTAGQTDQLKARVAALFADNLARYLSDGPAAMRNLVDYDTGY
jgi:phosphoglycerate dehydrogenase-like enzyme